MQVAIVDHLVVRSLNVQPLIVLATASKEVWKSLHANNLLKYDPITGLSLTLSLKSIP